VTGPSPSEILAGLAMLRLVRDHALPGEAPLWTVRRLMAAGALEEAAWYDSDATRILGVHRERLWRWRRVFGWPEAKLARLERTLALRNGSGPGAAHERPIPAAGDNRAVLGGSHARRVSNRG